MVSSPIDWRQEETFPELGPVGPELVPGLASHSFEVEVSAPPDPTVSFAVSATWAACSFAV